MENAALYIFRFIIGGLVYRVRGGFGNEFIRRLLKAPKGWEIPNGAVRLIWAIWAALPMAAVASYAWPALIIAGLIGASPGYYADFDLSKQSARTMKGYAILTARGMFTCLPLALIASFYDEFYYWYGVAAGALFVPCYLMGNVIHRRFKSQGHTQWGEWLYGGAISAAI